MNKKLTQFYDQMNASDVKKTIERPSKSKTKTKIQKIVSSPPWIKAKIRGKKIGEVE